MVGPYIPLMMLLMLLLRSFKGCWGLLTLSNAFIHGRGKQPNTAEEAISDLLTIDRPTDCDPAFDRHV